MKDLLKIISKEYLKNLNIVASEGDDNEKKEDNDIALNETEEDKPITNEEIVETIEDEEDEKRNKKFENNYKNTKNKSKKDEGSSIEEEEDEEDNKSESTKRREVKHTLDEDYSTEDTFQPGLQPGEMERYHIKQLKSLKERILKRLEQKEETNEETEEGDTNE